MENATYTAAREQSPTRAIEHQTGHTHWCDLKEHLLALQGEPAGSVQCISRPLDVGKIGGWISGNVGPEVAIVVDWRPEIEGQYTFEEARALAAYLVLALHVAGGPA